MRTLLAAIFLPLFVLQSACSTEANSSEPRDGKFAWDAENISHCVFLLSFMAEKYEKNNQSHTQEAKLTSLHLEKYVQKMSKEDENWIDNIAALSVHVGKTNNAGDTIAKCIENQIAEING